MAIASKQQQRQNEGGKQKTKIRSFVFFRYERTKWKRKTAKPVIMVIKSFATKKFDFNLI